MRWNERYKCDICGCSLDPGEGSICSDCKEKQKRMENIISIAHLFSSAYPLSADSFSHIEKKAVIQKILSEVYGWDNEHISEFLKELDKCSFSFMQSVVVYSNVTDILLSNIDIDKNDVDRLLSYLGVRSVKDK